MSRFNSFSLIIDIHSVWYVIWSIGIVCHIEVFTVLNNYNAAFFMTFHLFRIWFTNRWLYLVLFTSALPIAPESENSDSIHICVKCYRIWSYAVNKARLRRLREIDVWAQWMRSFTHTPLFHCTNWPKNFTERHSHTELGHRYIKRKIALLVYFPFFIWLLLFLWYFFLSFLHALTYFHSAYPKETRKHICTKYRLS